MNTFKCPKCGSGNAALMNDSKIRCGQCGHAAEESINFTRAQLELVAGASCFCAGDGCEHRIARYALGLMEYRATRDRDWILAIASAMGLGSGLSAPIVPEPEVIKRCIDQYVARELAEVKVETERLTKDLKSALGERDGYASHNVVMAKELNCEWEEGAARSQARQRAESAEAALAKVPILIEYFGKRHGMTFRLELVEYIRESLKK